MNTAQSIQPPAIGEVWLGQGGIYAGVMPARGTESSYHLILGDELGSFEWGPYGDLSPASSLIDGMANTAALVDSDGEYPAAVAAYEHKAEGHADFYLPAAAELYEIWLNLNGRLTGWVWSSSQVSAYDAYTMDFGDGWLGYDAKSNERVARPVRRLPIQ